MYRYRLIVYRTSLLREIWTVDAHSADDAKDAFRNAGFVEEETVEAVGDPEIAECIRMPSADPDLDTDEGL